MSAFLLGWFRLIWLFTRGHQALVLENLALRQQLAVYKRHSKRPRLRRSDRLFWIVLARLWKGWRQALVQVHPDTVVRWQRQRFRRYWAQLSGKPRRKVGRPSIGKPIRSLIQTMARRILCGVRRAFTASFSSSESRFPSAPFLASCGRSNGPRHRAGRRAPTSSAITVS